MKSMRSKVLAGLAGVVMFCSMAFAGVYEDGMALYKNKQYPEAIVELQKVDSKDANYYNAQYHIGHSLRAQDKHEEALAQFESVKKIAGITTKQAADTEYMVAHSLLSLKRYDEARTKFRALASNPDGASEGQQISAFYVGHAYYKQGMYDEALAEWAKMPDYPAAVYYAGHALLNQDKKAEAQEMFIKGCLLEGSSVYYLKQNFDKVSRLELGIEKYKELLDKMIFIIPAVPANADFLGELKSEQEKLK